MEIKAVGTLPKTTETIELLKAVASELKNTEESDIDELINRPSNSGSNPENIEETKL